MAKNKKTGLGRGLDSLIPVFPDDDESEENSSLTLEDMLKEKDEKDGDHKESKEENNSKNSKSNEDSKKIVTEVSKTQKTMDIVEKTDIGESKTKSKEITTEKPSTSESIEDEIETKNKSESSQITKKTDQPVFQTQKTPDTENMKIQTETSKPFDAKDEVVEVVNVTETEDTPNVPEKTDEDIKNNLTEREKQSIDDVIKIIEKNPRITLWSAKSAAVLRYLRKTEPEFSISKEASKLVDESIQNKYPEIWALFKDIEK